MPYAMNQGVRIHYQVEGTGPPLVLQHGYMMSIERWYRFGYVEALKPHYQLILVDARGHGDSDKPYDRALYTWPISVLDIVAVLDALNLPQAIFWGFSMGGGIGFGLAKYAPERLRGLIIAGASASAGGSGPAMEQVDGSDPEAFVAAFEARLGGRLVPEFRALVLASDTRALVAAAQFRPSLEDILPRIAVPCLMYIGELDGSFHQAQASAAQIPRVTFVSFPGLNHSQTFMRSDVVLPHVTAFLGTISGDMQG
jgi:pimeloyl-ACP methyl ester carboxylesterase